MNKTNQFFYGGSYVPLGLDKHIPMSEWEDGMREMKRLGINAFRAFAAWNRIERREGVPDFTELDRSMELAEKYGLRVLLNVGGLFNNIQGFRPPPWLHYVCHCTPRMETPGQKADLIMIDLHQPNMRPLSDPEKNLVYSGSKQNVCLTMVDGKILYENGRFRTAVEPELIYEKAEEILSETAAAQ